MVQLIYLICTVCINFIGIFYTIQYRWLSKKDSENLTILTGGFFQMNNIGKTITINGGHASLKLIFIFPKGFLIPQRKLETGIALKCLTSVFGQCFIAGT